MSNAARTQGSMQWKARYLLVATAIALAGCLQTLSLAEQIAALMREAQQFFAAKQYDQAIGRYAQVVKLDVRLPSGVLPF